MKIRQTPEFEEWFKNNSTKFQAQISARIQKIRDHAHFGDCKQLKSNLAELRWKNGRRVYFTVYEEKEKIVLLLLGGNKNGQTKDIKKARGLIEKYAKIF